MFSYLLNVFFTLNGKMVNVKAKSDEVFAEVAFRYMQNEGLTGESFKFFFNSKELILSSCKTLSELNIRNQSTITVIQPSVLIGGPPKPVGSIITITFRKGESSFKMPAGSGNLFTGYLEYLSLLENKYHFFINSSEIKDKNKTLADNKITNNSIIDIKDCEPEHCKICCLNLVTKLKEEKKKLKKQLDVEKDKNKKSLKEIDNLKQKLENIVIENKKMKELIKQQKELLDKNNIQLEYSITTINPGEIILAVNFVSMGNNDIGHYNLICKNVDLFVSLEERLYKDFPQFKNYNTYFEANGKSVKRFKTMDENKIKNNDIISIFITED